MKPVCSPAIINYLKKESDKKQSNKKPYIAISTTGVYPR